jgi:flagellar biogenesis protein FliO
MDVTQKPAVSRFAATLARFFATLREAARHVKVRRAERSLRLCETLALGERRLLLLVQCERRRYLLGAGVHGITLIDRLNERGDATLDGIPPTEEVSWKGLH